MYNRDMTTQDIRWQQRSHHFRRALGQLREGVLLSKQRSLSRLEQQGLIQAFEFTHELAWNTLKDFLEERGVGPLYGSRDATRAGFKAGLLGDGETWMQMIQSRNLSSHTYDEATASRIVQDIQTHYFSEFERLEQTLTRLEGEL